MRFFIGIFEKLLKKINFFSGIMCKIVISYL